TEDLDAYDSDSDDLSLAKAVLIANLSRCDLKVLSESHCSYVQQEKDLIECINKAMAFLSAIASRFPPSNNQLRTSSKLRSQATIQDGRVTIQQVKGRQN
nr:hypothetical protein [Tanacetum cinerariifolium]